MKKKSEIMDRIRDLERGIAQMNEQNDPGSYHRRTMAGEIRALRWVLAPGGYESLPM